MNQEGVKFDYIDEGSATTLIKVVGVGGAGGNAVRHMLDMGMTGAEFICINSDAQALLSTTASNLLQIGKDGLGAGMDPEKGRVMAEAERERITEALRNAKMVFITAGMGGGTGTGAAPVVASIARDLGILTVAVVTKPFSYEGKKCREAADKGLEDLSAVADSVIVILNEKLEEVFPDATFEAWLKEADSVLYRAVSGIAEIIQTTGYMNVDFNDVRRVMSERGRAMMGTAVASGVDRARVAAEQATTSPLLDGVNLTGARGLLLNITVAKSSLKGKEVTEVAKVVKGLCSEDLVYVDGVVFDDRMGDELRVTIIATGLGQSKPQISMVRNEASRTGTDDAAPADLFPGDDTPPEVFRTNTARATVEQLRRKGMNPLDIPAYIRRQAN